MSYGMPDPRDLLLTGIPRSGTTLCCHLLNDMPNTVALHEPITSELFVDQSRERAVQAIADFASKSRRDALSSGRVQSKQAGGTIPSNPVTEGTGSLREEAVSSGTMVVDKPLAEDFTLVIKHNALFAALLGDLAQRFSCIAVVRNPLATLASWQTVDLPIQQGRIPMGELFDTALRSDLGNLEDVLDRQVHILKWFYRSFEHHLGKDKIVRYEDLVDSNGRILLEMTGREAEFGATLENQNANRLYETLDIDLLLRRLLEEAAGYAHFYSKNEIENLAEEIRSL